MKYFDIHGHLNFVAYDADREEVIKRAQQEEIGVINVGTQIDTSRKAVELAENHEGMWATIGLHPVHTSKSHHDEKELGEGGKEFTSRGEIPDLDAYRILAKNPKTVAIGECGLDYYHLDADSVAKQKKVFESMIDVANEVGKPLMLHLRNGSSVSAYKDAYEIVKSRAKVIGDLHFFAGSIEEAKPFLDLGFSFSFTGVVTFARNYDEVIKYLPLNRIMSETDCPYVTPIPFRGKRNEPLFVKEITYKIAEIRGESQEMVRLQIIDNVQKMFGI